MIKNIYGLGAAIVFIVLALNSVSIAQAADVTLQKDTSISIPQVKVGDKYYAVTLKMSDNGDGQLPSFSLEDAQIVQKDGSSDATHDSKTDIAEIPSVLINGVGYTLRLQEDNTLAIEPLGSNDQQVSIEKGEKALKDAKNIVEDVENYLKQKFIEAAIQGNSSGISCLAWPWQKAKDAWDGVTHAVNGTVHAVKNAAHKVTSTTTTAFDDTVHAVKNAAHKVTSTTTTAFDDTVHAVKNTAHQVTSTTTNVCKDTVHAVKNVALQVKSTTTNVYDDVIVKGEKTLEYTKNIVENTEHYLKQTLIGTTIKDAEKFVHKLYSISKTADTDFEKVLKGKDLTSVKKHVAHIISENAHDIHAILGYVGADVDDVFLTIVASHQFSAGFGKGEAIGFGINLRAIEDDIGDVVNGVLDKDELELKLSQHDNLVQPFLVRSYTGGLEVGESIGVAYGIAYSLSGTSLAFDVSGHIGVGAGVSVSFAVPTNNLTGALKIWSWDVDAVTISAGIGEEVSIAAGIEKKTLLTESEFVSAGDISTDSPSSTDNTPPSGSL